MGCSAETTVLLRSASSIPKPRIARMRSISHPGERGELERALGQAQVSSLWAVRRKRRFSFDQLHQSRSRESHGCDLYRILAKEASLNVRSDKRKFPPYGLFGGNDGSPSISFINPEAENRTDAIYIASWRKRRA